MALCWLVRRLWATIFHAHCARPCVHGSCGHSAKDKLPHATMPHKAQAGLNRPGPIHVANHVEHTALGIRARAGRARAISSPPPRPIGHVVARTKTQFPTRDRKHLLSPGQTTTSMNAIGN
jgi:hypothetical protein